MTEIKERPILFNAEMVRAILDGRKTQTRRVMKPQPDPCHHCDGLGWYEDTEGAHGCGGDESICAVMCPVPERVQVQCQCVTGFAFPLPKHRYGVPGDRLWVRETWAALALNYDYETEHCDDWSEANLDAVKNYVLGRREQGQSDFAQRLRPYDITYRATTTWDDGCVEDRGFRWKPSIFMPRWASRIMLEIKDIRVERVQDADEDDCKAEGVEPIMVDSGGADPFGNFIEIPNYGLAFSKLWDSINDTPKRKFSWASNPFVWVVEFEVLK